MTLRSEVSLVKRVAAGGGVSVRPHHVAPADTVVGITSQSATPTVCPEHCRESCACGSTGVTSRDRADVYGPVRRRPRTGRGRVTEGDEVELFGTGADDAPTAGEWAEMSDTIDYEIITGIGGRIARRYVGGQS